MRKLLLLPLLFTAACGGDGPSGSTQLTADEAAELARAMFGMASGLVGTGVPGGGARFALTPIPGSSMTFPVQETVPCDPSGSTDVEGTLTIGFEDIGMGMSIQADLSAEPRACAHRTESGGIVKISGDPSLDIHLAMTGSPDRLTALSLTQTGAFTWTRGGASGRCTVDLASSLAAPTQMVTVTGTFCGFPVSETFPVDGAAG